MNVGDLVRVVRSEDEIEGKVVRLADMNKIIQFIPSTGVNDVALVEVINDRGITEHWNFMIIGGIWMKFKPGEFLKLLNVTLRK